MSRFTDFLQSFTSINMNNFEWSDVAEIIILSVLIYHIMLWIKTTRAWSLVKGFVVILVFLLLAVFWEMDYYKNIFHTDAYGDENKIFIRGAEGKNIYVESEKYNE